MQEEEKKMILVNSTISVEVVIVGGGMVSGKNFTEEVPIQMAFAS